MGIPGSQTHQRHLHQAALDAREVALDAVKTDARHNVTRHDLGDVLLILLVVAHEVAGNGLEEDRRRRGGVRVWKFIER